MVSRCDPASTAFAPIPIVNEAPVGNRPGTWCPDLNTLNDLFQQWGGDLVVAANSDILPSNQTDRGTQRVLRRLLTNPSDPLNNLPSDYIFHPAYGAGLPRHIGSTATEDEVSAICIGQMLLEDAVSRNPAPVVKVTRIVNGLQVAIQYTDAQTGDPVVLGFNVSE